MKITIITFFIWLIFCYCFGAGISALTTDINSKLLRCLVILLLLVLLGAIVYLSFALHSFNALF